MKATFHSLSAISGALVVGIPLLVCSAMPQEVVTVRRIPGCVPTLPYPPERLELVPVANEADDPAALIVVVQPGERLLLLGVWGGGNSEVTYATALPFPLEGSGNDSVRLEGGGNFMAFPRNGGIPGAWLDEGSYFLVESTGTGGVQIKLKGYLIGYRVQI